MTSVMRGRMPAAGGRAGSRIAFLVGLLFTVACGGETVSSHRLPAGTPVILISIDTLRSDRLPAYGYAGVETPAIDRLRADSILFERAYSHVPLTLPSHASILTGLLPPQHRVRDNIGYELESDKMPFLPRLLRQAGYNTGGAVSAFVLRANTGIGSNFDLYEDRIEIVSQAALGRLQRPGYETLDLTLPWLRSVGDEPFFLFFHIYEPHTPYEPPEPFASRYRDRYDGEVAAADDVVGRLLSELDALGLYNQSLIILLSDHGEGLGDHGQPEHEVLIYREIVQVPLLIKLPDSAQGGQSIDRPVQLIDIAPTVLDLLGMEVPLQMQGRPLLGPEAPSVDQSIYSETLYPRLHFGWSELTSVIQGRYQYIHGPDPELYDLLDDPGQTRNILRQKRRVYGDLKETLSSFDAPFQAPSEVDPSVRDKLAALGYTGAVGGQSTGPLPDPKSRLSILEPLGLAFKAFFERDYERAAEAFRVLLEQEPQLIDAWEHLGKSLHRLRRHDEALVAFEKAIELSGAAPHIMLSTAELLLDMERFDEAREHAELASHGHEVAWDVLTQIAIQQDDLEAAEDYLAKALELRGTRVGPLVLESQLRLEQGRFDEALAATRQAEEELSAGGDRWQLRGLYLAWGKAWANEGDLDQARTFFRREIELNPEALQPYAHLAFAHALEDDGAAAGAVLRQMVESQPTPEAYATAVETLRAMKDERSASGLLRMALARWPTSPRLQGLTEDSD